MIATGFRFAAKDLAEHAKNYLCNDPRNLFLGPFADGMQTKSINLITAICPFISDQSRDELETHILEWSKYREDKQDEITEQHIGWDQENRCRLLMAITEERQSPKVREIVKSTCANVSKEPPKGIRIGRSGRVIEVPPMTGQLSPDLVVHWAACIQDCILQLLIW